MIVACGEALIDMVPGTSGGEDVYAPCPGGSPYNTAIAAGRILGRGKGNRGDGKNAGLRAAFLSRISRDFFGEALVRRLEENNVSTALITRSDEHTTLGFVKLKKGKEPEYLFYTEGAADRSFSPVDVPAVLDADCLLFGSISLTMEPSASTIEDLVFRESARPDGPVISHDPNVRPMMIKDRNAWARRFESWVRASTIVKISSADFDFIYPGLGLEKSMEKILALGPRLLAVTLGAEGALALLRKDGNAGSSALRVSAPAFTLPVTDTIGAGDTFHGAFLAWLLDRGLLSRAALPSLTENSLREALLFANKAAAIVCSRKGANPPTLAEIEAL